MHPSFLMTYSWGGGVSTLISPVVGTVVTLAGKGYMMRMIYAVYTKGNIYILFTFNVTSSPNPVLHLLFDQIVTSNH